MDGNFISRSSRLAGVCGQNLMMPAASLPALAKNARTGHPDLFGSIRKFKNLGHPPGRGASRKLERLFPRENRILRCRPQVPKHNIRTNTISMGIGPSRRSSAALKRTKCFDPER